MPRGVRGKKKTDKAKVAPVKPIGIWVWAQCDNAGCQKWRKLPPGTVIDDKEPWFCYMNPNGDQNDCNIPEEAYDAAVEAAVYSCPVSEESVPVERDGAWTPTGQTASKQHKPKAVPGNGRLFQRPNPELSARGFAEARSTWEAAEPGPASRNSPGPAGTADAGWVKAELGSSRRADARDGGANSPQELRGIRKARRAHHGFNKLLAMGGVWEVTKGKGKAVTAPPAWVWEGLATHAPSGAQLACEAADASSAARYFEVLDQSAQRWKPCGAHKATSLTLGETLEEAFELYVQIVQAPQGSEQAQETADTARLALTAAAALAVRETSEIPGIDDSPTSGGSGTFGGHGAALGPGEGQAEVTSLGQPPGYDSAAAAVPASWARHWGAAPVNGFPLHPSAPPRQGQAASQAAAMAPQPQGAWNQAAQGAFFQPQKRQLPGAVLIGGGAGVQMGEGPCAQQNGVLSASTVPVVGSAAAET